MSVFKLQTNQNKTEKKKWCSAFLLAPAILALALTACDKKATNPAVAAPATPPPAGFVTARAQNVGLLTELPGRLEAYRVAEVRARVPGVILSRKFEEGSDVKAGQLLFQIDDAPYKAALQSAQAQLAQAQASLMQTRAQAERFKPLVAANAVSRQDYDNALAAQKSSQANVAAAHAAITTAKINLGYAAVTSPIDGRIGRALVTEGALVGQGNVTELAVVQQIDKLYVNFTQSATDAIKLRLSRSQASGEEKPVKIRVVLDDGTVFNEEGTLLFTDLSVDATTGQVTLRATLPNPKKLLLPGMYVRVRLEQEQAQNAFLVPQQAVTRNATGDTINVITTTNDLVETRKVTVSGRHEVQANGRSTQFWVVTEGLQDGDRIMIDGFQKWQMAMQGAMQRAAAAAEGKQSEPPKVAMTPVSKDPEYASLLSNNTQTTDVPPLTSGQEAVTSTN